MAWIFSLSAKCRSGQAAQSFSRHFHGLRFVLSDGHVSVCNASHCSKDACMVIPSGLSRSGVHDEQTAERLSEVGFLLFEHLKTAPDFLFSLVGVEVDDAYELQDIIEILPRHQGLVVCASLWERHGSPAAFLPFSPGMAWIPYQGEFHGS
jgi:hypothetical protein